MADFNDWTLDDAQVVISNDIVERHGTQEAFDETELFVEEHDHWQDGDGWVGPDGGSDTTTRSLVLAAVERQFTPRDVIGEVLNRMANALLRQEPDVDFVPLTPMPDGASDVEKAAAEAEVADLKAKVSAWWDHKKLWRHVRTATIRSRWAGRGSLRTWIAPGHLTERRNTDGDVVALLMPKADDLSSALDMVQLSTPEPDAAMVYVDEETQQRVAVVIFDNDDGETQAEIWWVDPDGKTVVRVVGSGTDGEEWEAVDLGGRLPLNEMDAEILVTEPVRRQQKRLNFVESLLVRVAETGGFPERYTMNAEPGGVWSKTAPSTGPAIKTTTYEGVTWYLHHAPRTLGAAITTDLVGVTTRTGDTETRATPSVQFKDPTDPEFAIKSAEHSYRTILSGCKQGHIATDGTQEASGVAYQQARADYEDDLNAVKGEAETLIRDTIEVALAWAAAMHPGSAEVLKKYRVSVTMHVRSGPVSPLEREQNNADVKAGTMAAETAIARNGSEDVDAELAKLRSSPESVVDLRAKQVAGVMEMVADGASFELAAEIMGVGDPELLAKFKALDSLKASPNAQGQAQEDEITALLQGTGAAA